MRSAGSTPLRASRGRAKAVDAIHTPLFGDDAFSQGIIEILKYDEVDVYSFDEHNYEWMSFCTALEDRPDDGSRNNQGTARSASEPVVHQHSVSAAAFTR